MSAIEIITRVHAKSIEEWGQSNPNALVLSGDLTTSCEVDGFRDKFPDRFLSMGLAEQNMMSFAAGLAREGFIPHVHTFAVFMYRRALDQIEMSIAYPNLPVKLFGFLPGVTTPGGASHQAINDIAVIRSLPNFTILETGDATDVESVIELANSINGPVYIRMVRGALPRLFPAADKIELNKARVISTGKDIALFSTGICTEEAMRAVELLRICGVSIQHLHVTTLKPFSDPQVISAIKGARFGTISMENHCINGGLGTCISEIIAEHKLDTRLMKIALDDTYLQGASTKFLMRRYTIDALALITQVEKLIGKKLNVSEEDLRQARIDKYFNEKQQEAL